MGKMITFVTILIFIEMMFLITGQAALDPNQPQSLGSILFNSILDIQNFNTKGFWTFLIGSITDLFTSTSGILSLAATAGVAAASSLLAPSDQRLYIPIAATLAFLAGDFVFYGAYLYSLNNLLATVIMAPILIIYILISVEWLRGKD